MGVRARAVAHGKLITLGCNPNLMDRIFDSGVLETLFFAKTYALGVGGRKTAELDVMLCYQMVKDRVKKVMAGRDDLFFSLIVDGASSKILHGHHVNAILIHSSEFPAPILLDLDIALNGSGRAECVAAAIQKAASEYGLNLDKLCVGLMADNASVNAKVARRIGFQRQLHCIAHSVALLILAAIDAVPGVKNFLLSLHAIFTAGGNTDRRVEAHEAIYNDAGLDIGAILSMYLNRWGTASKLIEALTVEDGRMLDALRLFFKKAKSVAKFKASIAKAQRPDANSNDEAVIFGAELDDDDANLYIGATPADDEDASSSVGATLADPEHAYASSMSSASAAAAASSSMAKATEKAVRRRAAEVGSAALRFVDAALKDSDMYAKLTLVGALTNHMDFLIKEASRNDSVYSSALIKDIQGLGAGLRSATDDGAYFVDPVLDMLGDSCSPETKAVLSGYAATAVKAMVYKFRHIDDWSETLRRKVLWDHRVRDYKEDTIKPGNKVANAMGDMVIDPRLCSGWFGMARTPTLAFIGQFNRWGAELRTDAEMLMEPGIYWRMKVSSYPLLYKLGLWFASIPLSAVAAERAIGLMREIETPKRNRIREPHWQAENFLRYNKWLTQLEFEEVLGHVNMTEAAIRARNPATAAAAAAAANVAPF